MVCGRVMLCAATHSRRACRDKTSGHAHVFCTALSDVFWQNVRKVHCAPGMPGSGERLPGANAYNFASKSVAFVGSASTAKVSSDTWYSVLCFLKQSQTCCNVATNWSTTVVLQSAQCALQPLMHSHIHREHGCTVSFARARSAGAIVSGPASSATKARGTGFRSSFRNILNYLFALAVAGLRQ